MASHSARMPRSARTATPKSGKGVTPRSARSHRTATPQSARFSTPIHGGNPDLDHYLRSLYQQLEPTKVAKTNQESKPQTRGNRNLKQAKEIWKQVFSAINKGRAGLFLQPLRRGGSRLHQKSTFEFDVNLLLMQTNPQGAFTVRKVWFEPLRTMRQV